MKLKAVALVAVAMGVSGLAQAAEYTSSFTLSEPIALHPHDPALDDGREAVGTRVWSSIRRFHVTPTGNWPWNHSADQGNDFGQTDFLLDSDTGLGYDAPWHVTASVTPDRIEGAVQVDEGATVNASASVFWSTDFYIDPHATLTFAGIANMQAPGAESLSTKLSYTVEDTQGFSDFMTFGRDVRFDDASSATLRLDGSASWGGMTTEIRAGLFDNDAARDINATNFSYSTDANGLLSLTITNNSDFVAGGRLGAWTELSVSAVPEPSTYMAMLLGLGVLGAAARKKGKTKG